MAGTIFNIPIGNTYSQGLHVATYSNYIYRTWSNTLGAKGFIFEQPDNRWSFVLACPGVIGNNTAYLHDADATSLTGVVQYNGYWARSIPLEEPSYWTFYTSSSTFPYGIYTYQERMSAYENLISQITPLLGYPITYYPTNVTLNPAPSNAYTGETVTVGVSVPTGYTLRDPSSSSIVVRNNGVIVPHTWDASSNQFTFIMPDPS